MSDRNDDKSQGVSRREFLKISGIAASIPMVGPTLIKVAGEEVELHGPGKAAVMLTVNGKRHAVELEPRITLLDALRETLDVTGPKRVCDRGTCGACTVLLEDKTVYSCSVLAIEAQGKPIVTSEGLLLPGGKLHPVQQAFVDHDAQQCGFCTSGFVIAAKAFLDRHPNANTEEIHRGLGGNYCRCGTYAGIHKVVAQLSKQA
jgi:xanthine dehydrogenase YagT iron-sulfur-binding subunit